MRRLTTFRLSRVFGCRLSLGCHIVLCRRIGSPARAIRLRSGPHEFWKTHKGETWRSLLGAAAEADMVKFTRRFGSGRCDQDRCIIELGPDTPDQCDTTGIVVENTALQDGHEVGAVALPFSYGQTLPGHRLLMNTPVTRLDLGQGSFRLRRFLGVRVQRSTHDLSQRFLTHGRCPPQILQGLVVEFDGQVRHGRKYTMWMGWAKERPVSTATSVHFQRTSAFSLDLGPRLACPAPQTPQRSSPQT